MRGQSLSFLMETRRGRENPIGQVSRVTCVSPGVCPFDLTLVLLSGIGGFMVRQRGGKVGVSRIKLCRRDSTELLSRDEGEPGKLSRKLLWAQQSH